MDKKRLSGLFAETFFSISLLFIVTVLTLSILYSHELKSISTLKQNSAGLYTMAYNRDYSFDDFLKKGLSADKNIEIFEPKLFQKEFSINNIDSDCSIIVSTIVKVSKLPCKFYKKLVSLITQEKYFDGELQKSMLLASGI